jgi:hypothetical protein
MELRAARAAARRRVGTYTAIVTVAGFAWLVAAGPAAARAAARDPAPVLLLAALVLTAELMPLELGRPGTRDSTTMSQPFAFALVLGWGTPAGVVALGVCSALADLAGGKAARKVLFNSAQLAIALGAAGAVYGLAGGNPPDHGPAPVSLPAFAAAALAFFVVNNLLVEAVLVLAGGTPALDRVRQGVGLRAWVSAMLLGMAPVATVVAQTSLGLVPILGLTTAAVYLACRGAIRADGAGPGRGRGRPGPGGRGRAGPPGRGRAGPDPPAPGERPAQAGPAGHRLPRAEDPAHGDPGHARDPEPPRDRPGADRAPRVRRHGRAPGHPAQGAHRAAAAGGPVRADQPRAGRAAPGRRGRPGPRRPGRGPGRPPGRELVLVVREPLPVRASPEAVLQVLGNLLDNAAKYAPDLGPVRLEATRYGPLAVLAVEDTGPGVPAPDRERVFERFTQLDSGATRRAGGVGLGLYIARQLAQAQDGELLLTDPTPPGQGARFELRLPLTGQAPRQPVLANGALSR